MLQSFVNKTDRMLNQTVKSSLRIVIFLMVRRQDKKRVKKAMSFRTRGRNLLRLLMRTLHINRFSAEDFSSPQHLPIAVRSK